MGATDESLAMDLNVRIVVLKHQGILKLELRAVSRMAFRSHYKSVKCLRYGG